MRAEKIAIWSAEVEDRAGGTAGLFRALAGTDITFAVARRQPDKPGKGILFVSPGSAQAGFTKRSDVVGVRVEGENKAGIGAQLTQALGAAGLNLRAISAHVIGKNFSLVFAFDSEADADKGLAVLQKMK
jgi:predicted amino acid-binding ACT domain protein